MPQADELLTDLRTRVGDLALRDFAGLDAVKRKLDMVLRRTFGEESDYRAQLKRIRFSPNIAPVDESYKNASWLGGISSLTNLIDTAKDELLLFSVEPVSDAEVPAASEVGADGSSQPTIFLVHGHDDRAKSEVARFIEKLGGAVVILHEQANRGRTLIEKFEQESSGASFAVVLLTADDIGGAIDDVQEKRARQNVVFELGYFVGALGRSRVAALLEEGVEKPGDYDGVAWIPLLGDWRLGLAKEMRAAGLPVDMNDAL